MKIRQAKSGDEHELIDLFNLLYQESDFLLMEPGESQMSVENQAKLIDDSLKFTTQVLFVAIEGDKIIGFLGGTGGKVNRNRHSIHIAMGVLSEKQGKGVGCQLLNTFIGWAASNQFHRIELSVMEDNVRAKALYEKMDFQSEGLKHDSLKINDGYINEYFMVKFI